MTRELSPAEIKSALSPLIGLPLSYMWHISAAGFQAFGFGAELPAGVRKGEPVYRPESSIHVQQSGWRICKDSTIVLTGEEALFRKKRRFHWRATPPREPLAKLRWLDAKEFFERLSEKTLFVRKISADRVGGIQIILAKGYRLEIWPMSSERDAEFWRLLPPNDDRGHFVVEASSADWSR